MEKKSDDMDWLNESDGEFDPLCPMFNVYYLNYYGINVFLCAGVEAYQGEVADGKLRVYELQSKIVDTGRYRYEALVEDNKNHRMWKPKKKEDCLLFDAVKAGGNTWTKPSGVVDYNLTDGSISFVVSKESPLYKAAVRLHPEREVLKSVVVVPILDDEFQAFPVYEGTGSKEQKDLTIYDA